MLRAFNGPVTVVHTTQKHDLGTIIEVNGKQYVYCKGVASGAAGAWVTITAGGVTALLAADAVGRVGVMMAALSSATTTFGWVQIYGANSLAKSDTTASGQALYIDGTAGRCDDAVVSGDLIVGAHSTAADTSNVLPVFLNFPYVTNILG